MKSFYIVVLFFVVSIGCALGQTADTVSKRLIHRIGFDFRSGYVLPTHSFLEGENYSQKPIDQSLSLHLKYAFQYSPSSYLGQLYPHTYQGIGISYNTFFNKSELGNPTALYVFQSSRIKQLSSKLSIDYEWNFGASFGWHPYDEATNSMNKIVGSKVNAYINVGFFLNMKLDSYWNFMAGIDATHYSNGNTRYPNSGVNTVGARMGLVYRFDSGEERRGEMYAEKLTVKPHVSYDLVLYGATRAKGIVDENYLVPGVFGVVGFNINPMYNFNKRFKAGISLDGQYDECANIDDHIAGFDTNAEIRFYEPSLRERIGVGFSLRGELVMPVFAVNVGIGHNFLYEGDDLSGLYQILALKANLTRNIFLHVGYQLSKFRDPKNLMLGFGFHFHNKRR